ncbi:MAG: hypothetical protein M9924_09975 [Rhizobiaceae bacterium]|nr:hypothetical protein [Rhizobiaceae bacterium]
MSDFVAVLKRTLEGLGETSPEMRQRVYDKARSTIGAKLAGMNPPPPAAVAERQRRSLEEAIAEVERSFAPPAPARRTEPLDELENVLNSLNGLKNQAVIPPKPRPAETYRSAEQPRSVTTPTSRPPAPHQQPVRQAPPPLQAEEDEYEPLDDDDGYDVPPSQQEYLPEEPAPRRGFGRLIAALLLLIALAGGGYAAWLNKDQLQSMVADLTSSLNAPSQAPAPAPGDNPPVAADVGSETPEQPPASNGPVKFTQQLNPDGSEADAGPAQSGSTVGEGSSVAEATSNQASPVIQEGPQDPAAGQQGTDQPEDAQPPADQPADTAQTAPSDVAPPVEAPAAPAEQAAPADQAAAVPVGQRAIFYEERTNSADGSAEPGSIVWSVVQESPGGDRPPEPAIRAEATIPGKEVQLRMTIRRNADTTLPASHIIEMIFLTPQNFEGGGIDNVLRVALKSSEQDAGTPLSGIPAKISDGFFLIALNDAQQDMDANMRLLRERSWLDVPIVYKSGRRALITMEKGIPGEKVFDDVLKAWGIQSSG